MRRDSSWDDDEIETRVFFQPEEHEVYGSVPMPTPPVRTPRGTQPTPTMSLLADDAFSVPSLANILEPEPTIAVRRRHRITPLQLVIASASALLGIAIGGVIAFTGHSPTAHAATVAPKPAIVVAPIAPAPIVVAPAPAPPPAPVSIAYVAPASDVASTAHHHRAAIAKGTLRIAAKPPCSIAIDGKATGMVTPQAALRLALGHHSVTLTNAEHGIKLTKAVTIEADHPTSLIQNFLD